MTNAKTIAIAAALLAMGGCDRLDDQRQQPPTPGRHIATSDVQRAINAVPAPDQGRLRQALACAVKRRPAGQTGPIAVTPAYIQDLSTRVAKDPSLARC